MEFNGGHVESFAANLIAEHSKPDGTPYYEMIFIYTDDLLVVSHKPMEMLTMLDHHYHLKSDSIGTPKTYLQSQVKCFNLNDDPTQQCWALSSEKYIQDAVHNLKVHLESQGQCLRMGAAGVLPSGYRPELDVSPYCDDESGTFYQQEVHILQWIVELECIDIGTEVSMMASYSMAPREGHLQVVLHMFAYLSTHQ